MGVKEKFTQTKLSALEYGALVPTCLPRNRTQKLQMWKVEGWVEKRLSTANSRFIEIRNTNAAAKVGMPELVAATKPDIVLTMEVE